MPWHMHQPAVELHGLAPPQSSGLSNSSRSTRTTLYAERRLIQEWVVKARKHGQSGHQVISWVRRKVGPSVCTWRFLANGELGCATPCILCSKELLRFGFKVVCSQGSGQDWYQGHLDSEGAPRSKLTSAQSRQICGGASSGASSSSK